MASIEPFDPARETHAEYQERWRKARAQPARDAAEGQVSERQLQHRLVQARADAERQVWSSLPREDCIRLREEMRQREKKWKRQRSFEAWLAILLLGVGAFVFFAGLSQDPDGWIEAGAGLVVLGLFIGNDANRPKRNDSLL